MTRNGPFNTGVAGSYTLSVYNGGTATDNGPVKLVDTLPAGVTYLGYTTPRGWSCSAAGRRRTGTRRRLPPTQTSAISALN